MAFPQPRYVTRAAELVQIAEAVEHVPQVGLDIETAAPGGGGSLDPRTGRVRLLSLATPNRCWVIDCDEVPHYGEALFPALERTTILGHNLLFDLQFLRSAGLTNPGKLLDTMLLSQILAAGREWEHKFASVALRTLKIALPKREQKSDWGAEALTPQQIAYAGRDAQILLPLAEKLLKRIHYDGQDAVVEIENRCLAFVIWMSSVGVGLDRCAWEAIIEDLHREAAELGEEMNRLAPPRGSLFEELSWSWDNAKEWKAGLAACGYPYPNYQDGTLALWKHPIADVTRKRTRIKKRIAAFGEKWLSRVVGDRIYPSVHQLRSRDDKDDSHGTVTGRLSYSNPNLQQMPREERYRRCFVAPPGRVLVKSDYSQIEVRLAAYVANETFLLNAYKNDATADIYKLVGAGVLNKPVEAVTKADRQIAKSLVLGLQYGMGVDGLRAYAKKTFGIDFDEEQATTHRKAFFDLLTGFKSWHRGLMDDKCGEVRTLTGRCRRLNADDGMTVKANTKVQGTAADGVKRAAALMWERRDRCPGALPVLCVHDEIVVECDEDRAEETQAWQEQCMLDGMQALARGVPVAVESKVARSWGG